jgi:hypothetical protein
LVLPKLWPGKAVGAFEIAKTTKDANHYPFNNLYFAASIEVQCLDTGEPVKGRENYARQRTDTLAAAVNNSQLLLKIYG